MVTISGFGKHDVSTEALRRIGELYAIEAKIRGKPPDEEGRDCFQHSRHPDLSMAQRARRTVKAARQADSKHGYCLVGQCCYLATMSSGNLARDVQA